MSSLPSYMKGHKVPLARETEGVALGVYLDEAVRALYPEAQLTADRMQDEYLDAFVKAVPGWLRDTVVRHKGFRPWVPNPLVAEAWLNCTVVHNPLAKAIRRGYVAGWLLDHPTLDEVIAFELLISSFKALGFLTPSNLVKMRTPLIRLVGGMTGFTPPTIKGMVLGKRAAQALARERVGAYYLVQERRLLHGALVFAARYCTGPDAERRTWDDALQFVENGHGDLLHHLGINASYNRPTEALKAAKPFIRAFTQKETITPVVSPAPSFAVT
jgi:hypothetical protein